MNPLKISFSRPAIQKKWSSFEWKFVYSKLLIIKVSIRIKKLMYIVKFSKLPWDSLFHPGVKNSFDIGSGAPKYSQLCWSPLDFVLSMFDDFWQLLIFKFWKRRHAHCPTKPWKFYLLFVVWFEKSGKIWKFYLAKYDQTERIHAI